MEAVGWDGAGSPFAKENTAITHEIVDRPVQKDAKTQLSRMYIQPQWVFDSINAAVLLPCHEYEAGQTLPPHLSHLLKIRSSPFGQHQRNSRPASAPRLQHTLCNNLFGRLQRKCRPISTTHHCKHHSNISF